MEKRLSHVDEKGNPAMVDVGEKASTLRRARAQARVILGHKLVSQIKDQELTLRKGPVFQTAILAGIMAAKKTSDLIPLCHPLALEDCKVTIQVEMDAVVIESEVRITGKTGVEMEALTAASVAALTIYDMCKAVSHDLVIGEIKLMEKTGGKRDFKR